jgi:hypothetical protein
MARSDIKIGDRYGMLTIVREMEPTVSVDKYGNKRTVYNVECLCDCGNNRILQFNGLKKSGRRGTTPSCGCRNIRFVDLEGFDRDETIDNLPKKEKREIIKKMIKDGCTNKQIMSRTGCTNWDIQTTRGDLDIFTFKVNKENPIGKKFGLLTVVGLDENNNSKYKYNRGYKYVMCDCECGTKNKKVLYISLRHGNTVSCGCYFKTVAKQMMIDNVIPSLIVHGDSNKKSKHKYIFDVWQSAKQRCYNPNNKRYKTYGKLGITMYDEWVNNYPLFKEYILTNLGERPEGKTKSKGDSYSMDRIDVTKGYEPDNLRWASFEEQSNNKLVHVKS